MQVVTAAQMRAIEAHTAEVLGIPTVLLMENAGRQVAAFAWHLLTGTPVQGPGLVPLRWGAAPWAGARARTRGAIPRLAPLGRPPRVAVVAGKGNNGGDGLVAARFLHSWGCQVAVLLWADPAQLPPDARLNWEACVRAGVPVWVLGPAVAGGADAGSGGGTVPPELAAADLVIDALLGTGVRGAPRGPVAAALAAVAAAGRPVLAVDLPSGVDSDTGAMPGACVQARWTLALGLPKRAHVLYPGAGAAGEVWVADIGIPLAALAAAAAGGGAAGGAGAAAVAAGGAAAGAVAGAASTGGVAGGIGAASAAGGAGAQPEEGAPWVLFTPANAAAHLPRFPADVHKGARGRVLVAGGSQSMPGAAALAALAALRAGAGLVVAAVPAPAGDLVAARGAEIITRRLPAGPDGALTVDALPALLAAAAEARAVAVGPGLSQSPAALAVARELVLQSPVPVVLDADGVRAFAGRPEELRRARSPVVLTPHPGEMAALLGTDVAAVQAHRAGTLARAVAATGQTVLLKGPYTLVGAPGEPVRVNVTGGPALATAGSGDVLTGIIAALLAQGLPAPLAAATGACLHGLAGEWVGRRVGPDGALAGDLLAAIPAVRRALVH